jgi:putative ABC transport system permease protein
MTSSRPSGSVAARSRALVGRPRARFADIVGEAAHGIARRPMRSVFTAAGTTLGVGAFVITVGLAATVGAQISDRFDLLKATEVSVEDTATDGLDPVPFPEDTDARLARLHGVRSAGRFWTIGLPGGPTLRPGDEREPAHAVPVVAASPGLLGAARPTMAAGRVFDRFHRRERERVAVVGVNAAADLGLGRVDGAPAVFIDGVPFTVIGVIGDVQREQDLLSSIVVPDSTALDLWGAGAMSGTARVLIDVQPGAAQVVGRQAAIALLPQDPERLRVVVPPEPRLLRRGVEADSTNLYLALAAVTLLIGAIGIANTTLVSVMERTTEIGVRRSLGAARRHIGGQFLAESALLGAGGGLVGAVGGLLVVLAVAGVRHWAPTVPPIAPLAAPVIGTAVGLLAGIYPAMRATAIQPLDALRAGG